MAEQIQNSTVTPSAVLAAEIVAPAATGSVVSAAELPASGTFSLLLKGDSDDGSDDGIIAVGAITGTALSSITWVRNGQGTFPAGTEVELDLDARALKAVIDERADARIANRPGVIARTNLRTHPDHANGDTGTFSGTFTPDPRTRLIEIEMVGGGGGGGAVSISASGAASGGGGGSGTYRRLLVEVAEGQTFDYTLGAGGEGGEVSPSVTEGYEGEGTSFDDQGASIAAMGGLGGYWMTTGTGGGLAPGGGSNSAFDGDVEGGAVGQPGMRFSNAVNLSASGAGGGNPLGKGAEGSTLNGANNAADYGGYGGGGSGGQRRVIAGSQRGGNGADGTIIVWEHT